METTWYYENIVRYSHPEIEDGWVERVVANPFHTEVQSDGRLRYYGYIEETGKWVRVILEDGKLLNRFFGHGALKRWGIP